MKHYDAKAKLGITNNMDGNLVTWGEGSYACREALKAAGFRFTKVRGERIRLHISLE